MGWFGVSVGFGGVGGTSSLFWAPIFSFLSLCALGGYEVGLTVLSGLEGVWARVGDDVNRHGPVGATLASRHRQVLSLKRPIVTWSWSVNQRRPFHPRWHASLYTVSSAGVACPPALYGIAKDAPDWLLPAWGCMFRPPIRPTTPPRRRQSPTPRS